MDNDKILEEIGNIVILTVFWSLQTQAYRESDALSRQGFALILQAGKKVI